jgi:two-component system response regulator FixJ
VKSPFRKLTSLTEQNSDAPPRIARVIVVVEDDPAVRDSTIALLEVAGHDVRSFESGSALLETGVPPDADVILLDVMMPGMSGLETLRALTKIAERPAIIMLTGHGDIPLAVEAMKLGAEEFLEKPYPMQDLLELVATIEKDAGSAADSDARRTDALEKLQRLTRRQREVLRGLALGEQSKGTAYRLNLSVRTVEAYRGQLFSRLGARGMADAVRIAVVGGLLDE